MSGSTFPMISSSVTASITPSATAKCAASTASLLTAPRHREEVYVVNRLLVLAVSAPFTNGLAMAEMRRLTILAAILGLPLLSGCTSQPDHAELLVNTTPPGASCVVAHADQAIAVAEPTPAIVLTPLAITEVAISCHRPGYADYTATVPTPTTASVG